MASPYEFRLPDESKRVTVVGRTGTGKTHFGVFLLSLASYTQRPFIIFDYKGDELIGDIPYMQEIDYRKPPPKAPGLYVVRPHILHTEEVENFLWKIWERENTGMFFDEAYMVPSKAALNAIYTQGRAKKLPAITLSQRPVSVTRFAFTEADFFAVFHLNDKNDRKRIEEYSSLDTSVRLPNYHANWYDVGKDLTFHLSPAPDADTILDRFETRLAPKRRVI
jgi:hypothetical protein